MTNEANLEIYASGEPEFDPNVYEDRLIMRERMATFEGKKLMFDQDAMTLEQRRSELQEAFESYPITT